MNKEGKHKKKFDAWMKELDFWTKKYEELIEIELGIPIKFIPLRRI